MINNEYVFSLSEYNWNINFHRYIIWKICEFDQNSYFQFVIAHHMDPFDQTVNKWVENAYANLEFLVTSATHAQMEPALH